MLLGLACSVGPFNVDNSGIMIEASGENFAVAFCVEACG